MLKDRRGHALSKSNPALSKNNRTQERVEQQEQPKKLPGGKLGDTLRRLGVQQKEYVKRKKNRCAILEFYTSELCLVVDSK